MQLHPVPRGLRPVAAGCHVAPAAAAILRLVLKHPPASRIGTPAHAHQLAEDERIGRAFDDGDQNTGERIADGHEGADEPSAALNPPPPRSPPAPTYTI